MQFVDRHIAKTLPLVMLFLWLSLILATSVFGQEAAPAPQATGDILEEVVDPGISEHDLETLLVPLTVDELAETAAAWQKTLRDALTQAARLNNAIEQATGDERAELRNALSAQAKALNDIGQKYTLVVGAWARKGADPDELAKHRAYRTAVATESVRATDPTTLLKRAGEWLIAREGGLSVLLRVGGFVIAVWAMFFVAGLAQRGARRGLRRVPNISKLLVSFVLGMVYWLTFAVGIMFVLALFGVNITPLFAVFGGASFILGFALQEVLGD